QRTSSRRSRPVSRTTSSSRSTLRPFARRSRRCSGMREALFTYHGRAEPEEVADIVRTVFASMRGDLSATEAALLAEIEELGRMIAAARVEITALRVDDITDRDIPAVTDELDAIVAHTAAATESILESCETLDRIAGEVSGATAATLQVATTRIYEACGF